MSDVTMKIVGQDGTESRSFTMEEMEEVTRKLGGSHMKNTAEDEEVATQVFKVTAAELRSFIERYERLEQEKKDIADQQKEVMAEAKGRGYDVKVMKKIIALRKREPADVSEEEAITQLYREALGM